MTENATIADRRRRASRFERGFSRGAFRGPRAAAYCDMSPTTWKRLDAAGQIPRSHRKNGVVLWVRSELNAWLDAGMPDRTAWEAIKAATKR